MSLVSAKSSLSDRELALLESEMRGRSKSIWVAFALWFFVGMLGGHRFYLKRGGEIYLVVFVVGLVTSIILIGFLILAVLGLFVLIDAFRISNWVESANREIESQIITEIVGHGPARGWQPASAPTGRWVVPERAGSAVEVFGRLGVLDRGNPRPEVRIRPGDVLIVGRDGAADVRLDDPQVSRRHATVAVEAGGWVVSDLGATNSTRVVDPSGAARVIRGTSSRMPYGQVALGNSFLTLYPLGKQG